MRGGDSVWQHRGAARVGDTSRLGVPTGEVAVGRGGQGDGTASVLTQRLSPESSEDPCRLYK